MDFKFTWERFINGFDAIEENGAWDKEEYGEMEVYCENILISVYALYSSRRKSNSNRS